MHHLSFVELYLCGLILSLKCSLKVVKKKINPVVDHLPSIPSYYNTPRHTITNIVHCYTASVSCNKREYKENCNSPVFVFSWWF